jgi:hypothetical protein
MSDLQFLEFKPETQIILDGCLVPHITASKTEDEKFIHLSLDHRFGINVSTDHVYEVVWFLANAMAFAAGFSCFGENCQKVNPFNRQILAVTGVSHEEHPAPPKLELVRGTNETENEKSE